MESLPSWYRAQFMKSPALKSVLILARIWSMRPEVSTMEITASAWKIKITVK